MHVPRAVGGHASDSKWPYGSSMPSAESTGPVVFFDGVCNLCNAAVQFVIDHDKREQFRFAPLQSDAAQELVFGPGLARARDAFDSLILLERGKVYERSHAALRIARRLDGLWRAAFVFVVVPRCVRDAVYDVIAQNRYRWFGRSAQCRVPTPAQRARFLA
jgi:predicted DCC family thiol-disulfide oxidoreductase YuxK